ncbi:MAG: RNA polymerase sigma factor [Chloroflexia bacterium]
MDATLVPLRSGVEARAEAIRQVYEAHSEQIYRFLFFKLGNREDAEDVTAQVFMKAAISLDLSQSAHSKLAWLYQVARTSAGDYWRLYYRTLTTSLDQMEVDGDLGPVAEPIVLGEDEYENPARVSETLHALLALLTENYRRVLELRFLESCSLRETAEVLGMREGNVRVLQHRALHRAASLASGQAIHFPLNTEGGE